MHSSYCKAIVAVGLVLLVGGMASGQTPLDNDLTDSGGNTGGGTGALYSNTGFFNTAYGFEALKYNSGSENTAIGQGALNLNVTGNRNTASGTGALELNTFGSYNTASGFESLFSNQGTGNTASGYQALYYNTGSYNTAHGYGALLRNTAGIQNTATGTNALLNNTMGPNNIALGINAGLNLTTGSNNIDIGHPGVAGEDSTIRVGNGQARTFIAGIAGKSVVGTPVVIASSGQLGVMLSSARYKRDIQDMGKQSHGLLKLRPVTFFYTTDAQGEKQYGLIAEEVAQIYPELVTKGADGQVESVQYHSLIPMLLNEVQRQEQRMEGQAQQLRVQSQELAELQAQNASLRTALHAQHAALVARLARLEEGAARPAALQATGP